MQLTINILENIGPGLLADPLVVPIGGVVVNGVGNAAAGSTAVFTVPNENSAIISVALPGYLTYNTTVTNVYGQNRTISILMTTNIEDINNPLYGLVGSRFFTFDDPCDNSIDYYSASNIPGDVSWYINNELYQTGLTGRVSFCSPGNYQLKQRSVAYRYTSVCPTRIITWDRQWVAGYETGNTVLGVVDDISTYLALDTATNVAIVDYRPEMTLMLSSPSESLDDGCCYPRDSEVYVTPTFVPAVGKLVANYTATMSIMDPLEETSSSDLDLTLLTPVVVPMSDLGVYTLTMTVTDISCGTSFTRSLNVNTCNFLVISETSCSEFTIDNRSLSVDVEMTITDIEGNTFITQDIAATGSVRVTLPKTSLYKVSFEYLRDAVSVTEIYVINNYCVIEDCLGQYILDILCEETRACPECPDETTLNQMLLLWNVYFMKLNNEYGWNNYYSALSSTKIDELTSISQLMSKLETICKRIGCVTMSNSSYGIVVNKICKSCG